MEIKKFQICLQGRNARWVVLLNNSIYGAYLDKEQALIDAVDAARDAQQADCEVQVWVRDQTDEQRLL